MEKNKQENRRAKQKKERGDTPAQSPQKVSTKPEGNNKVEITSVLTAYEKKVRERRHKTESPQNFK